MSGPCDISHISLSNCVGYIEFTTCFGGKCRVECHSLVLQDRFGEDWDNSNDRCRVGSSG